MIDEQIARLEQRLEQVEGALERARRQKRTAWAVGACGVTAAIIAATATVGTAGATATLGSQALTVKAPFRVVDASGALVMQADTAGIRYYRGGQAIAGLTEGRGGGQIYTADRQGGQRALMFEFPDGQPGLKLINNAGSTVAGLQTRANGTGELVVEGLDGRITRLGMDNGEMALRFYQGETGQTEAASIGTGKTGGEVQVNDKMGKKMAHLGSNGKSGSVAIYDTEGSTRGLLSTDPTSGDAELDLLYRDGTTPAAQLAEVAAGGYFALTNRAGTARVEAGTLPSDQGILRVFGPGGFDYIRGRKA